ncbi:MAG: DegT/DnrJ/EryC1/StrS family aminotransferase [Spirochaetaceae bacterium]|nr:MAG: DegT/DnrJ/EryC1/StrS family aminotransferase [Spirochaetaceae bacterium]
MSRNLAVHKGEKTVPTENKIRWPVIIEEDKQAVMEVLNSGKLWGPYAPNCRGLESEFAAYVGTKYCIAFNSGTAALHAAVRAAGIGPGDEVITSAYSFLASAVAVLHSNGIPVFVDIDPKTHNIDPGKIEEKITEKTKAIIPVHIEGTPADLDEILRIAEKHDLIVIEDAAEAHGTKYKGRNIGTIGDMAIFSLNTTKNLPGGEGGLFVTNNVEYRGRANMVRMFGEYMEEGEGRSYVAYTLGWNYRTQEMPAAFARSQLRRLDKNNENSRRNGEYLSRELAKIKGLEPPFVPAHSVSNYYKYRLRLKPKELGLDIDPEEFRDKLLFALREEGVDVAIWQTKPLVSNPLFQIKDGYGSGCPWSCPFYNGDVIYSEEHYPATIDLLKNSIIVGSEEYPLFPQKLTLMQQYVEAFRKAFDNIEEVLEIDVSKFRRAGVTGRAEEL